jgi:hypothetical protein
VFYKLNEANTNEQMQAVAPDQSPDVKHRDDIFLKEKLFRESKQFMRKGTRCSWIPSK